MNANERTFQGELYQIIRGILSTQDEIKFSKITQEENVGTKGQSRFADGKLYSSINNQKVVLFELKNTTWDATDDALVMDAALKAMSNGYEFFVTGTPRQLVLYRTFEEGVPLSERKLKIYNLSNVKNDNDVLLPSFEREVTPKLRLFLAELSNVVHGEKEVHWDSIDRFFVNRLSAFILDASVSMFNEMYPRIERQPSLRNELRSYLKSQNIFNVTFRFDEDDVYKICQLANYLLYLKLIFYSYLQRDVPKLKLKPLEVPLDVKKLNKLLRARFDDVLTHDFEMIFSASIFDKFEFESKYLPTLKQSLDQISHLNFREMSADIIGSIYNTLIDNQEQHDRGQHFTNTNEVDIVNAFCINENTRTVLDSGCGAGTFLVRAYSLLKHFYPESSHQQLLERVWGIEIAPFPAFLSVMNLSLLNIQEYDNYPIVIQSDFSDINSEYSFNGYFLNANKSFYVKRIDERHAEVKMPMFDSCVGNPPYIRQEKIEDKLKWTKLAKVEAGIPKVNQQSDLYFYYLIHTAAFLKEGGRLGYVISSSWLDVSFGAGLQKFILDNFKVVAIIDHQTKRSFETALINTVILIIEKCSDQNQRKSNNIKFVRVYNDYERVIGKADDKDRFERVKEFTDFIESQNTSYKSDELQIETVNQSALEDASTIKGEYVNGFWGAKYLRSPEIYRKFERRAGEKFTRLHEIAEVKYGVKTGANDFFYLVDETEKAKALNEDQYKLFFGIPKRKQDLYWKNFGWFKSELTGEHHIIERQFIRPVYKSQREAENLDVKLSKLTYSMLYCGVPKKDLSKTAVIKYIEIGESREHEIHKRPSVAGRKLWYDLTNTAAAGDFIFPSKIGERFRLIDNRKSQVFCDKVNYVIEVKPEYKQYCNVIFLYLNSTIFRFLLDLFSRQMVVKVSDVDVNLLERTPIIRPQLLQKFVDQLRPLYKSLKSRPQGTIYQETQQVDRFELDSLVLSEIGLDAADVRELHRMACKYVKDRQEKSESLDLAKTKKKLSYDDALELARDRFSELSRFKSLVAGHVLHRFSIPDGEPSYPRKSGSITQNLFGIYSLDFSNSKTQKTLEFDSAEQFELFEFLNRTLGVSEGSIRLPKDPKICFEISSEMRKDYESSINQLKALLKSNRSAANPNSIYRDVVMQS